jgi:hypothetical protein
MKIAIPFLAGLLLVGTELLARVAGPTCRAGIFLNGD